MAVRAIVRLVLDVRALALVAEQRDRRLAELGVSLRVRLMLVRLSVVLRLLLPACSSPVVLHGWCWSWCCCVTAGRATPPRLRKLGYSDPFESPVPQSLVKD